ncbi:hypothetical protein [Synechococcus sp. CC9902]|uniref:hypothetical protein n=1 Tax=Synechococcus sp. (strain CC9902) TaxID=316279 RepID=UPI0003084033|nr:hypothetical protein [Synechococcus sp. CC9902]
MTGGVSRSSVEVAANADQFIDERLLWWQPTLWRSCFVDGKGQERTGITKVALSALATWCHALEMQFRKPLQQRP